MAKRRVVLTGLGTVNPLAHTVPEFWSALIAGKSGIRAIRRFDTTGYASRIGGEVQDWDCVPTDRLDARESKRMDRFTQFAVASGIEAVADSGIDFEKEDRERCGVIVGSGIGGLSELEEQHKRMLDKGPGRVSPFTVPKLMANAAAGNLSILYGLRGPNFAVVTACASAANSTGEAYRSILREETDVVITGGSEAALTPIGLASFCALKGLSTRNDHPEIASRPWDKDRDGFLLAEGAGVVVLEELEHAKARGAKIYAELIGYAASADGYHITAPDPVGKGASMAMRLALQDAGVAPEDVQYINAHGTSTELGDIAEARAVKQVFGDWATGGLMVSSTKSSTGHLLGASGGVELIASALTIKEETIPATFNLDNPGEECDLDFVPNTPRQKKVNVVLSNSFGFGGHNACLLLRRFE
ncbi:MAG: 3-oxoacyl-(acyl-carrier-protein) synthase 2 [Planctomycetes bacterium ADurb.Bin126]|nr:MAG: 3-oxoacyl-(acyl-carrier-protein) synthase 2 [Planctomycetes bacterium ADurb.Bin126]HOD83900.1 beta-ketoacyl-ACP synthase II [Phycisphaerae bacterium]HQL75487.1 beta-ketoacyl-ACP synthase II [Phycisphaerae bacterium]